MSPDQSTNPSVENPAASPSSAAPAGVASPPWTAPTPTPADSSIFALPTGLARKADPAAIAADEAHLQAISAALATEIDALGVRIEELSAQHARLGQEALDRDLALHRATARRQVLRRFGADLCLGRMVGRDDPEPVYIGRIGLTAPDGRRLLVDWRAPAAEPFFGATHADPHGLVSRRRYRWTDRRVTDYWDEVFDADALRAAEAAHAALDDQSAFIASLGASRSARMRDVLSTIQADQDAIVRASARGALVVDGGPGTGKTVVALHRAAYLMHAEPRLGPGGGGMLFVGPHRPYLAYVEDVLPSLGEDSVRVCTLPDLVPEGRDGDEMPVETDPEVLRLKSGGRLLDAVTAAVRYHEQPPETPLRVETPWRDLRVTAEDWADAFDAAESGTPHNEARDVVWDALIGGLVEAYADDDLPPRQLDRALRQSGALQRVFARAWPVLDPAGVVADLWSVPAYLRLCARWLTEAERSALQRTDPRAWTRSDLPFLDAARDLIGDPSAPSSRRREEAVTAEEREYRERVIDELLAADDDLESAVTGYFRGPDGEGMRDVLLTEAAQLRTAPDALAGPFAHLIVDEAQELTDAEWRMLLRRVPSRSLTIVGDRAQARHGFRESWRERLERIGLKDVRETTLSINYRTPEEVMQAAEPVIRAVLPDANVPTSVRRGGIPVRHAATAEQDAILSDWLSRADGGIACVIGGEPYPHPRVRSLTPQTAKGLEFDLVVLADPASFGEGVEGAVDRYVAMTRATRELVVLHR